MRDFPSFMKKSDNKVPQELQNTPDIQGFYYTAADGSQMAFWTCLADRVSREHRHDFDEYMICVEGEYVVVIDGLETTLHAGDELVIPKGSLQGGRCKAGTRTIHAFGGPRVKPASDSTRPPKTGQVIGMTVKVTIDRPLGTGHPNHPDMVYPVNYGYVEGVIAPDGEEQDAYVLGVDHPVRTFTGQIVAVVHRHDDVEEKWVVALPGQHFTREEIKEQIEFQEKFFDSEILV